jgi:hypothetical protein
VWTTLPWGELLTVVVDERAPVVCCLRAAGCEMDGVCVFLACARASRLPSNA